MATREKAYERLGATLDSVAARFPQPLAAVDIAVDLGHAERLEGDDRIRQAATRLAAPVDHAHGGKAMMAPAREQPEQLALDIGGFGGRQNPPAERDRSVAGKHHLVRAT